MRATTQWQVCEPSQPSRQNYLKHRNLGRTGRHVAGANHCLESFHVRRPRFRYPSICTFYRFTRGSAGGPCLQAKACPIPQIQALKLRSAAVPTLEDLSQTVACCAMRKLGLRPSRPHGRRVMHHGGQNQDRMPRNHVLQPCTFARASFGS